MNKNCDCNNIYNTILKIGYYYWKEEKVVVKVNIWLAVLVARKNVIWFDCVEWIVIQNASIN